MAIKEAIARVAAGRSLEMDEAGEAMEEIVHGIATPSQIAAFAVALRMKRETPAEIAGLAKVMRREAVHVEVSGEVVDTCGTGGDGRGTFNTVSYTHLRAHETRHDLVCRLLLEKKKKNRKKKKI